MVSMLEIFGEIMELQFNDFKGAISQLSEKWRIGYLLLFGKMSYIRSF